MDDERSQDQQAASTEPPEDAASGRDRESESSFFNRVLRGARDWLTGSDEESSAPTQEPSAPAAPEPPPVQAPAETITLSRDDFARAVQSAKDRELLAERRRDAVASAEAGDVGPIRRLAERGDAWARQQLAERGETWTLGEITEAELKAQAQRAADPVPHVAALFDQAILHPLLGALPEAEEQRIVGTGIVGVDARKAAAEDAIKVIQREARHEGAATAVEKALSDPAFVGRLLRSETFRQALVKTPAANKQFRAFFRGDLEEADLNAAAGAGSAGRRENDFMNAWLRDPPWDERSD